ncbi:hypothetical protein [Rickettsiella endosymbiont of Dermanyssus gallinae]|uniref:hypothetical protein n=1 Tax=Rickettsiella endosymbiont of Dermanyssus gallinae TaxID=2856608 RepID=UPI001C52F1A4|nr:hypothetical protein [Rickettsiella endosymbiont of Dermanyssus gallinae]
MNLDPRYIIAPALEQFYINKKTGLPLAKGKITFYKDNQRTSDGLKSIYTLSGAPPNYSYVELPNPLTLSAVGTIQDDNGNNVLPFYFPYDEQGNLELYYVTVYSSDGVLQFTREGWPNTSLDGSKDDGNITNFIPNGQFLIHNNIPAKENKAVGEITEAVTLLAPAGWTFNRPEQSTAKDLVLFERFGSAINNPTGYPRYAIRIGNQLPSPGDLVKDLRISFRNVNRFASTDQYYTFAFTAQTNTGNALNVTVLLIKNFGEGGSPIEEKIINTVTITSSYSLINVPFIFGENQTKTLGLNDDDTVAIALRFPTNSVFDISLTDFILTSGNFVIEDYPQITDTNVISQSLAGSLPVPRADGYDDYLPIVNTKKGLIYYDGDVGKIYPAIYPEPSFGELLCIGTRYLRTDYSQEDIPYARVAQKLWNDKAGYYRFGTGTSFVSANLNTNNQLILTTNRTGAAKTSSAETSGFTVEKVFKGNDYGVNAFLSSDYPNRVYVQGNIAAGVAPPNPKTSGFNIVPLRNGALVKQLFYIECTDAKNLAGKWLQFSNTTKTFGLYFTIDGKGSNPVPSNLTAILLPLLSTQTVREVAIYLAEFLGGHQLTRISCTDASKIKPDDYWTFSTSAENFNVFARINNQGEPPPAPISGTNIPVDFIETDTMPEVAQKIKIAINQFCFAVPDLRDAFIRGWNQDGSIKTDDRYFNYGQGLIENSIGSFQFDEILIHSHPTPSAVNGQYLFQAFSGASNAYSGGDNGVKNYPSTGDRGGSESRPQNFAANYVMKY